MNGVHDLGGMHGFGPIEREVDEPLFHAPWEARVRGLMSVALGEGYFNLDAFRYGIERMEPAQYLRASYYERWLASAEHVLIAAGLLSGDELDARTEHVRQFPGQTPAQDAGRDTGLEHPRRLPDEVEVPLVPATPRFAVGDAVMTRNVHPTGHTRLPRYARGKRGVIHLLQGTHVLPDTNAHGLGEHPQPVYNVRFDGRELWGSSAEPNHVVSIDLWESYLEPAPD